MALPCGRPEHHMRIHAEMCGHDCGARRQAGRELQGAPVAQTIPVQTEENGEGTNDTDQGEEEADGNAEEGETAEPVEATEEDAAEVEEEAEEIQPIQGAVHNFCRQDCESCDSQRQNGNPDYADRRRGACLLQPGHAADAHLCLNCSYVMMERATRVIRSAKLAMAQECYTAHANSSQS